MTDKNMYVSSVEGRMVPRYGTRGTFIGVKRDMADPSVIIWDTERVVMISEKECNTYRREYGKAFKYGDLIQRTYEEWAAQNAPAAIVNKTKEEK